jgi:hypothetical protein
MSKLRSHGTNPFSFFIHFSFALYRHSLALVLRFYDGTVSELFQVILLDAPEFWPHEGALVVASFAGLVNCESSPRHNLGRDQDARGLATAPVRAVDVR